MSTRHEGTMDSLQIMDIAYNLEAEGVYGPDDTTLSAEHIAPVIAALSEKDIPLSGYWNRESEDGE